MVLYSASPAKNDSTHTKQCCDKGYSWSGGSSVLVTLLRIKIDPINMEEQILQHSIATDMIFVREAVGTVV